MLGEWRARGGEAGQGHDGGGDFQEAAVGAVGADELEADGQAGRGRGGSGLASGGRGGSGLAGGGRGGSGLASGGRGGSGLASGGRGGGGQAGMEMAGCALTVIREQERIQSI